MDREKEVIRLGSQSGDDLKWISPEEIDKAIEILNGFKKVAQSYLSRLSFAETDNADLKAVATSAIREADNRKEFIDKIYKETGIEVEVIDGKEEAKLIYMGVQEALSIRNKASSVVMNHFVTKPAKSSPVRKWFLTSRFL